MYQIIWAVAYLLYQLETGEPQDRDVKRRVYAICIPTGFVALLVFNIYRGARAAAAAAATSSSPCRASPRPSSQPLLAAPPPPPPACHPPVLHARARVRAHAGNKTWSLWKAVFDGQTKMYDAVKFALGNPNMVREADLEDENMWRMEEGIAKFLVADFGLFIYNFRTGWWARGSLYVVIYLLWATGPYLTDPTSAVMSIGNFIVLLDVLVLLSTSVLNLQTFVID
eukprot:5830661-Pleurochrysis_carterae.AAC.1